MNETLNTQEHTTLHVAGHISHSFPFQQKNTYFENITSVRTFPWPQQEFPCAVVVLINLAEPHWVFVSCTRKVVGDVMCIFNTNCSTGTQDIQSQQNKLCASHQILRKRTCFSFHMTRVVSLASVCLLSNEKPVTLSTNHTFSDEFRFPFYSRSNGLTPLLFTDRENNIVHMFTFEPASQRYVQGSSNSLSKPGFLVCSTAASKIFVSGTLFFTCKNGVLISTSLVCDGAINCKDQSDELLCHCEHGDAKAQNFICKTMKTLDNRTICSPLYQLSADGECTMYNSAMAKTENNNHLVSLYSNTSKPNNQGKYHLQPDELGNEERLCQKEGQIPCLPGFLPHVCYDTSQICVYKLNVKGQMIPCQRAEHLESCVHFECNGMFKCPRYYCIPWELVCDGKWDCPRGLDEVELCENDKRCEAKFNCRSGIICLGLNNVCDGHPNCLYGDDEWQCDLKNVSCPDGCHCLGLAIFCVNICSVSAAGSYPFKAVLLYSCIQPSLAVLNHFHQITLFQAVDAQINRICNEFASASLEMFKVKNSPVHQLQRDCFCQLGSLRNIQLTDNEIRHLDKNTFSKLPELTLLNLSQNRLEELTDNVFMLLPTENIVLSVFDNPFTCLGSNSFGDLEWKEVETGDYRVCCLVNSKSLCVTEQMWFASCSDMLPTNPLKFTAMALSLGTCVLIATSIILHWLSKTKSNSAYVLVVTSDNVAETFYACYLCTIWVADKVFVGTFFLKGVTWKSSFICSLAYGTSLGFFLVVPATALLLALSRLMVVWFPVDTKFKDKSFVFHSILCIFTSVIVLATVVTFVARIKLHSVASTLCLPFVNLEQTSWLTWVVTWAVSLYQAIVFVLTVIAHHMLLKKLKSSQKEFGSSVSKKRSNTQVLILVVVVSLCNGICWISSDVVYLVSLFLSQYPMEMTAWTAVAVTPSNSVINLCVFIVTGIKALVKRERK